MESKIQALPDGPAGSGGWQLHAETMERERDYYRQRASMLQSHQEGQVWYWQDDGEDHLESMVNSLPVVIRADQLRALISREAPIAGPGWKLVPIEPTTNMLGAVVSSMDEHLMGVDGAQAKYRDDWAAWLAAAPTPAAQADSGVQEDSARYRWLREECNRDYVEFDDRMFELDTDLDDAIDAALAAQAKANDKTKDTLQ